jgi:trehalose 6-phosphate phosphatase
MSGPTAADVAASRARIRHAAAALRRLFEARPAGLLTDIDGTISRITAQTNDAVVSDQARRALGRLAAQLDLVAIVTGRAVDRARRMVGAPELAYVGNHGLEWLRDGLVETHPAAVAARPALQAAIDAVRAAIPDPGLVCEDKGVSVAIHYRLAADPMDVGRRMLAVIAPYVQNGALRLIEGALVVNLLPALAVDKGLATRRLIEQHGLRSAAFFGDDVTDVDAFRSLHTLQAGGQVRALSVGVTGPETAAAVRDAADVVLHGVDEVERALAALARRPSRQATGGGQAAC